MMIKVKNLVPKNLVNLKKKYLDNYSKKIYSQGGEDIILTEILGDRGEGFYVDIGAHHPTRFSNTYMFYKKGWTGINIDPLPGSMQIFKRKRPRDINIEIGISEKKAEMIYYMFNEPALNTFSRVIAEQRDRENKYTLIEKKRVQTLPLADVLDKYLEEGQRIDFINIDVEGLDLDVLKSNNWEKYPANYLLVECLGSTLEDIKEDASYIYLKGLGYKLVAKTFRTCIFNNPKL